MHCCSPLPQVIYGALAHPTTLTLAKLSHSEPGTTSLFAASLEPIHVLTRRLILSNGMPMLSGAVVFE